MADILKFEVVGEPVPWHTFVRGYMTAQERQRQKKLKAWQASIALQVQAQLPADHVPWDSALVIRGLVFRISKPKSSREKHPIKICDIDRLENALLDALQGVKVGRYTGLVGQVFTNDRRIVSHRDGPDKIWATEDNPPGVSLQIERMV